jgi:peptidoglycan/LPS O-acetylase OafA/YrhL
VQRSPVQQARFPLLDGIRALAIAFVIVGHLNYFSNRHSLGVMLGSFGVSIFFVLSGYLITRSMLFEERRFGQLSLKRFYFRRALRIFPAFYAFLIVLGALSILGIEEQPDRQTWIASASYFRNFTGFGWETGHLWSLALEEQFYLLWPVTFILIRRRRLASIGVAVALSIAWRAVWIAGLHGAPLVVEDPGGLHWRPDLRLDTFLIGGAFAIADWNWVKRVPPELAAALLLFWHPLAIEFRLLQPVESAVTAFLIATLIAWLVANPGGAAGRALSHPYAVLGGTLSYSIYLWQQLFFGSNAGWWSFPGIAVTAFASYTLIERPFLRLRDRPRTEPSRETTNDPGSLAAVPATR